MPVVATLVILLGGAVLVLVIVGLALRGPVRRAGRAVADLRAELGAGLSAVHRLRAARRANGR